MSFESRYEYDWWFITSSIVCDKVEGASDKSQSTHAGWFQRGWFKTIGRPIIASHSFRRFRAIKKSWCCSNMLVWNQAEHATVCFYETTPSETTKAQASCTFFLLLFQQPTVQTVTTINTYCVFAACSYLFVSSDSMKYRLLKLLLDHPMKALKRMGGTHGISSSPPRTLIESVRFGYVTTQNTTTTCVPSFVPGAEQLQKLSVGP